MARVYTGFPAQRKLLQRGLAVTTSLPTLTAI